MATLFRSEPQATVVIGANPAVKPRHFAVAPTRFGRCCVDPPVFTNEVAIYPEGAQIQSRRDGVLANQTAQSITTLNTSLAAIDDRPTVRLRRRQAQRSMWPMAVVSPCQRKDADVQ